MDLAERALISLILRFTRSFGRLLHRGFPDVISVISPNQDTEFFPIQGLSARVDILSMIPPDRLALGARELARYSVVPTP